MNLTFEAKFILFYHVYIYMRTTVIVVPFIIL